MRTTYFVPKMNCVLKLKLVFDNTEYIHRYAKSIVGLSILIALFRIKKFKKFNTDQILILHYYLLAADPSPSLRNGPLIPYMEMLFKTFQMSISTI